MSLVSVLLGIAFGCYFYFFPPRWARATDAQVPRLRRRKSKVVEGDGYLYDQIQEKREAALESGAPQRVVDYHSDCLRYLAGVKDGKTGCVPPGVEIAGDIESEDGLAIRTGGFEYRVRYERTGSEWELGEDCEISFLSVSVGQRTIVDLRCAEYRSEDQPKGAYADYVYEWLEGPELTCFMAFVNEGHSRDQADSDE